MSKFAELDAAIIKRINGGFRRFYEIWPAIPSHLTNSTPYTSGDPSRVIDRRLQALRKQGKLMCRGRAWYLAESRGDNER